MKKIFLVAAVIVLIAATSCSSLQNTVSTSSTTTSNATTTTASTTGKNAGVAIDALTAQYKADGNKLDYKNLSNIANMINLVAAGEQLYNNKSNSDFRKGFIKGLVANSINIDEMNAETVTNQLTSLVDQTNLQQLQSAASKGQATAAEVQNVATSVSNILSLFSK